MSEHSVGDAEKHLSDLIDRALAGEGVVITRDGRPVVALHPLPSQGRPVTPADLDWLAMRRVTMRGPREDAGPFVSRLRDEEW
ncbi:type II toxin-antitoxin system Phd/YefM family antitoxin [Methylobacterium trifolii]|uniref:Antitoxin n=1 Tax=Methylobacterium trifolii TaxID=1003092 RepID=A0ABQ4TV38_9HYPH|nr:type II toxin-antitoxin system prevent-host-death family antitoxin [Methylobacterium trifolii]GJE58563.1 hypothetical protein MPOCJGCO_0645 [Methylobacterium trifolii]